jgi:hypothetical protein
LLLSWAIAGSSPIEPRPSQDPIAKTCEQHRIRHPFTVNFRPAVSAQGSSSHSGHSGTILLEFPAGKNCLWAVPLSTPSAPALAALQYNRRNLAENRPKLVAPMRFLQPLRHGSSLWLFSKAYASALCLSPARFPSANQVACAFLRKACLAESSRGQIELFRRRSEKDYSAASVLLTRGLRLKNSRK